MPTFIFDHAFNARGAVDVHEAMLQVPHLVATHVSGRPVVDMGRAIQQGDSCDQLLEFFSTRETDVVVVNVEGDKHRVLADETFRNV